MHNLAKFQLDYLIVIISIVLSFGSLVLFGWLDMPNHAGLGGAAAVALSFLILFLSQDQALKVYSILSKEIPEFDDSLTESPPEGNDLALVKRDVARLHRDLDFLRRAIKRRSEIEERFTVRKNRALAVSSVIGTFTWAIGFMV